ncbi:PQ loop repeat protein [uncultured archaeon]|nr:PQ loop repeat protein [uncultured archaeon]
MIFGDLVDSSVLIGFVAGFITTFSYVPQLIKVMRTKSAKDLSYGWLSMTGVGFVCWNYYAYNLVPKSVPMLLFNTVSLCFVMALLVLKSRYK